MDYQAVCFDYGGVLYGKTSSEFGSLVCTVLGVDDATYKTAYFHHNKKVNRDEISWTQLWELVLAELGMPEKLDILLKTQQQFVDSNAVNIEVVHLVETIHRAGYKTGLLSNNSASVLDDITKNGIIQRFDIVDISAITSLVKPDPKAFEHLARELGIELQKMIFIDDSEKSLSTAAECSYTPILFKSYEQLVGSLTDLGVRLD